MNRIERNMTPQVFEGMMAIGSSVSAVMYAQLLILEAFSVTWKTLGDTLRYQAEEGRKHHRVRQEKAQQEKGIERCSEIFCLQLRQVKAFRSLEGNYIPYHHLYLHTPV